MSRDSIDYDKVPVSRLADSVKMYIEEGISGGGFLTALLSNDLVATFSTADDENREVIGEWVSFLYNDMPYGCWGSKEKVQAWIQDDGITGRYKMKEVSNE